MPPSRSVKSRPRAPGCRARRRIAGSPRAARRPAPGRAAAPAAPTTCSRRSSTRPGSAASRSRRRSARRGRWRTLLEQRLEDPHRRPLDLVVRHGRWTVSTRSGFSPDGVALKARNPRSSSPAPTSRTSESAISSTTSPLRNSCWRPPAVDLAPASLSVSRTILARGLERRHEAEQEPGERPRRAAGRRTPGVERDAARDRQRARGERLRSARLPQASRAPSSAPAAASTRLSTRNCRISRAAAGAERQARRPPRGGAPRRGPAGGWRRWRRRSAAPGRRRRGG